MTKPYISHVEFKVKDLRKAARFYSALLGLRVRIIPKMKYAIWHAGRQPGGGFALAKRSGTTVVFSVDDIDAYLQKAVKLGGKVVQKKKAIGEGFGYYGAFTDPFGNRIEVHSRR